MTRLSRRHLLLLSLLWPCLAWAGPFEQGEAVGRVVGYALVVLFWGYMLFARWSDVDGQGGFLFRVGVVLLPVAFAWGTLRAGFRNLARVMAFVWMLAWLGGFFMGVTGHASSLHPSREVFGAAFAVGFVPACEHSVKSRLSATQAEQGAEKIHQICKCVADDLVASHTPDELEGFNQSLHGDRLPTGLQQAMVASVKKCANPDATTADDSSSEPAAPAEPALPPDFDWEAKSADGRAVLAQKDEGGKCALSCAVEDKELWREERSCEDRAGNTHFVANDCGRWMVFYAAPTASSPKYARFISVYNKTALGWDVMGGGLVHGDPPAGAQHLIAGMGMNPGTPPKYSSDGRAVEFATVQNVSERIPLFDDPAEAQPATRPAKHHLVHRHHAR